MTKRMSLMRATEGDAAILFVREIPGTGLDDNSRTNKRQLSILTFILSLHKIRRGNPLFPSPDKERVSERF
jgi:ABC-type transporter Mla maintaining outer membrane lipid asymmetry ATPase subunit MlaF